LAQERSGDAVKAGWETVELAKLCTVFTDGNWIESKDQSADGIRLVQTGNVGIGEFKDRRDKARFIDSETFDRLKCFEVVLGDCLISRLPDPVGRACKIPETGDKMITAVDCSIVRADPKMLDCDYFIYYSQSRQYVKDVDALCSGTTRRRISRKNLGTTKIPLPPLEEQKRIAAVLDAAFEGLTRARTHIETNLQNARELFGSFAASVFTRSGRGWIDCTIGDVITLQRGIDITKKDQRDGAVPVVSSGGVKSYHDTIHAIGPGVVVGRKGSIGSVHYVADDYWPHDTTLWVRDFKGNEPKLVYYLLRSMPLSKLDTGTANPSLNRNLVHPVAISWPTPNLQTAIVAELSGTATETEALQAHYRAKLQDLDDLRQSLLQKAFAGELT
jgi:type I restriction enzyme, S subunit